jgi:hypothetical protein
VSLLDSEVEAIKAELGYNILTIGALPYVGHSQLFSAVVQPYMGAGASTTSSTAVTAATAPTPVTLTLASATGFATFARVVVDVDDRQEVATVQALSGSTITVLLSLAHTGTYPVTVEGGETLVRAQLGVLRTINTQIVAAASTAGIKRVDVIEFYGGGSSHAGGMSQIDALYKQRDDARDRLAALLGVPNLWRARSASNQRIAMY